MLRASDKRCVNNEEMEAARVAQLVGAGISIGHAKADLAIQSSDTIVSVCIVLATLGILSPWLAAMLHHVSSVSVVLNSARLSRNAKTLIGRSPDMC